jgi:hypothetical protein
MVEAIGFLIEIPRREVDLEGSIIYYVIRPSTIAAVSLACLELEELSSMVSKLKLGTSGLQPTNQLIRALSLMPISRCAACGRENDPGFKVLNCILGSSGYGRFVLA